MARQTSFEGAVKERSPRFFDWLLEANVAGWAGGLVSLSVTAGCLIFGDVNLLALAGALGAVLSLTVIAVTVRGPHWLLDRERNPKVQLRRLAKTWLLASQGHVREIERISLLAHSSSRIMLALMLEHNRLIQWAKERGMYTDVKQRIEWIEWQVLEIHYAVHDIAGVLPENVAQKIDDFCKQIESVAKIVVTWDSEVMLEPSELRSLGEFPTEVTDVIPIRDRSAIR